MRLVWRRRAGFVFDSSGPLGRIITAAPAHKSLVAEFQGVAAHAGIEPEKGRSAVVAAARAVAAMQLGRIDEATTANVGLISGGAATNIVPEHCRVEAEARSREPARLGAQIADMLAAVNEAATLAGVDVATSVVDEYARLRSRPRGPACAHRAGGRCRPSASSRRWGRPAAAPT